jgi:hypothetical protein
MIVCLVYMHHSIKFNVFCSLETAHNVNHLFFLFLFSSDLTLYFSLNDLLLRLTLHFCPPWLAIVLFDLLDFTNILNCFSFCSCFVFLEIIITQCWEELIDIFLEFCWLIGFIYKCLFILLVRQWRLCLINLLFLNRHLLIVKIRKIVFVILIDYVTLFLEAS